METITTEKEKVIKEEIEIYRAFDGKEFSSKSFCARYELVHKYNLQKISTTANYYEFYTVKNIDELKEMILLDTNRDDFNSLAVNINGVYYKNLNKDHSALEQLKFNIEFPIMLAQTDFQENDWHDIVSYKSVEKVISETKELIKYTEETLNQLNKIKEKI